LTISFLVTAMLQGGNGEPGGRRRGPDSGRTVVLQVYMQQQL